jgi:periplasmic protein CpxP/Spy
MALTSEQQNDIAAELRRFSTDLNLAEDQKVKLRAALTEARIRVAEHLKANPNASRADVISKVAANREAIRQRLVDFLSPEQLAKWDAIVTKAKEFLGQRLVA